MSRLNPVQGWPSRWESSEDLEVFPTLPMLQVPGEGWIWGQLGLGVMAGWERARREVREVTPHSYSSPAWGMGP